VTFSVRPQSPQRDLESPHEVESIWSEDIGTTPDAAHSLGLRVLRLCILEEAIQMIELESSSANPLGGFLNTRQVLLVKAPLLPTSLQFDHLWTFRVEPQLGSE
jgi:hypothetical protein